MPRESLARWVPVVEVTWKNQAPTASRGLAALVERVSPAACLRNVSVIVRKLWVLSGLK
jgi:hypothetical protein